jgi:hypothetical protein
MSWIAFFSFVWLSYILKNPPLRDARGRFRAIG